MNNSFPKNQKPWPGKQAMPVGRKDSPIPIVSTILQDGSILEMVYKPDSKKTEFVLWKDNAWSIQREVQTGEDQKYVPYSPKNNLIQNQVILLPSQPEEYGTEDVLLEEIQSFIHKYVDISPLFEKISSYYVLFSWIYDSFNELPYLRLRGDPGSGKTRFLLAVGSLCYKPIFASGASTASPLFRILDAFRGTLIIDESDFRFSDEKAELTKILNQGNSKGFPVLRSEMSPTTKEYDPIAYHVYGPKIIASRGFFEDRALESRFFTEEIGQRKLREDIPINLPDIYKEESLHIRNKLLLFRFRNLQKKGIKEKYIDRMIEPRLNQIFTPILSIVEDEKTREDIRELARTYNEQMISDRGLDLAAKVLEILKDFNDDPNSMLSIKTITDQFNELYKEEFEVKITPKLIGNIIRTQLYLKTKKYGGIYIIPKTEIPKLSRLYERYGLADPADKSFGTAQDKSSSPQSPQTPSAMPVDNSQAETMTSPQASPNQAMPADRQEPYLLDE